ncbi:hypothetical protein [Massilia sp. AB1]|uniref:hypothetical protein n=1 Tax=Massilia sp. AB1 TaxID=2823371 RepID=UPI001B81E71C|nr:hypothetical protein [Massilia sp. AB1]MBQ5938483.1 hypothetical protein [Massilia sp. AB1]
MHYESLICGKQARFLTEGVYTTTRFGLFIEELKPIHHFALIPNNILAIMARLQKIRHPAGACTGGFGSGMRGTQRMSHSGVA